MSWRAFTTIALLAMALLTLSCGVQAEEAGDLQAENGTVEERPVRFMFVQTAQSGTLVPVEGEDNLYTLILMGTSLQTTAFSDRSKRAEIGVLER
jgi:invasion protein IalB